ncbi:MULTISPECIES: ribokinase [Acidobacteriaceae]|uniref:ribokinase n=1 Tax=Acidobacteriaceae TaxID=204434 RepID=UPI00131D0F4A|nr:MULTISPECIES: ribokinase [Acidobacteriaceae]MDW5265999.1 ribokinase [Edaphobacter sp.]
MKKIVVVGSINLDLVSYAARMPLAGETILGEGFATHSGGKGANQAVCAARLGGDVSMVGRLGEDSFASELREGLNAAGVDTGCVENVAGSSGTAIILVTADGSNSIVVNPGANASLRPQDLLAFEDLFRSASIILSQLEIPLETVEELGRIAERFGVPFLLDPAPALPLSPALLKAVTWLTPNESECQSLLKSFGYSGVETSNNIPPEEAVQPFLDAGVRNVILKLGERGVYMAGRDVEPAYISSFPVTAIDTTAAGDAFNGGFAFGLTCGGLDPLSAARFANAVAAVSVTKSGAQSSMPQIAEVDALSNTEEHNRQQPPCAKTLPYR